jgi:hypothetical protein
MKRNKHPVDDFFKEALQGYQVKPSDNAKQRFLDEANTINTDGRKNRSRWLLLLAGFIIISSAAILLWWGDNEQSAVGSEQSAVGSEQSAVGSEQSAVDNSDAPKTGKGIFTQPEISNTSSSSTSGSASSELSTPSSISSSKHIQTSLDVQPPSSTSNPSGISNIQKSNDDGLSPDITISDASIDTNAILATFSGPVSIGGDGSDGADEGEGSDMDDGSDKDDVGDIYVADEEIGEISSQVAPNEDSIAEIKPLSKQEKRKINKNNSAWRFTTSVYYFPEWMFNTLEDDKFVSNFGVEESFRFGRYSIRTGIGLSIAKGTNERMIEYNDYLGSYEKLDSIRFHWDDRKYHLIPTYFSTNKDVWDSLLLLDYTKVVKRYTYLQIPLILGYDILQTKRISLGFRAGPVLSILIKSKQLSREYDPGKNRIIQINQVTPERVQTNWQVMGGINLSLYLSKRFGLEIEPNIKYYFNSVYEKSDATKKPWSVGFRAAISIHY